MHTALLSKQWFLETESQARFSLDYKTALGFKKML